MKTTNSIRNIRTLVFTATVGCLLLLTSINGEAQELVTNGGFSNGTATWSTSCSIEIYAETVYGGSVSSNNVTEIDVERCFNQNVCIFPGSTYNFGFKATRRISSSTPASVGISVKVTGVESGIEYVSSTLLYTNTTFNLTPQGFSFNIPANSADRRVNIQFSNYNNTGTYGVLIDDTSLSATNTLSLIGPDVATQNVGADFSVLNSPSTGVTYNWAFDANSNPSTSSAAAPAGIKWSVNGNKSVSVGLGNGYCTVASLNKPVVVSSVLAVNITGFSALETADAIKLRWTAADDNKEGKFFIVERAAENGFDSIGKVAALTVSYTNAYSFDDRSPLSGLAHYRLKIIDQNGASTYSKVISVSPASKTVMQLYPNPAVSNLFFEVSVSKSTTALVQVFSNSGRIVISKTILLNPGLNRSEITVSALQPGAYFVRITAADGTHFAQALTKK